MKAALYTRVSSAEQAREGFSLPAQEKALREYCDKNGIEVYRLYSDEGIPGSKENRPQFQAMIKDAAKNRFSMVLVHKFDRFARKVELSQRIKNTFRKQNISVISITEPIEDSPIGFFQEGMLELLSEYYIKNLSVEVKKGQREKVSQGKAINMMPYGYKNVGGKVSIVDVQAEVVRLIFKMYNEGNGSYVIARYLNENGIKPLKKGIWNNSQINYMLKNIAYTGALKWAKQIHENAFPAIIEEEYFNSTQKKIVTPKGLKRKEYYNKFLLLGILRCGECGSIMRISKVKSNCGKINKDGTGPKIYYNYCCSNHRYNKNQCGSGTMYGFKEVDESFMEFMKNTSFLNVPANNDIPDNRRIKIERDLEKTKKAFYADVFTLEEYAFERKRLENELESIEVKPSITPKRKSTLWNEFLETQSIIKRKAKLQELIKEIRISKSGVDIDFY